MYVDKRGSKIKYFVLFQLNAVEIAYKTIAKSGLKM